MLNDSIAQIQGDRAAIASDADDLVAPAMAMPSMGAHAESTPADGFAASLKNAIHGVNDKDRAATDLMNAVDNGSSDDLVGAMLSSQQASLSFSMLMQVRNKVMGAIDDLVKLPI